jgi:hypothetical protein
LSAFGTGWPPVVAVDAVVYEEVIEVGRRLLGHGGQDAEAHLDVALGVEQHDLLVRPRQCQTEAEAGMAAHRRVAELDVERLVVAEVDPVAAATAGDQDRVAAVGGEGSHHVGGVHHLGGLLSTG